MKIHKNCLLLLLAALAILSFGACRKKSYGSGIVQYRMGSGAEKEQGTERKETEEASSDEEASEKAQELYVIEQIDAQTKTVFFRKVRNGRQVSYAYDTGTQFLDIYGNTKSTSSYQPGDAA